MSRLYTGVDPGSNGAIATITSAGEILEISRFSEAETHGMIALIVADHLAAMVKVNPDLSAAIERVGAMPRQGVASTFTFGRVYGEAFGGLLCSGIKVESVTPAAWQRELGLPKRVDPTSHKRALKQLAEARWGRRFTLAECDAVWIAEWCRIHGPWKVTPSFGAHHEQP